MPELVRNIEALRQLRRVVEDAPDDERFDMGYFTLTKSCGTAHCAAGWFAVDPWARANTGIGRLFDERGYPLSDDDDFDFEDVFGISTDDVCALFYPDNDFEQLCPIEAKSLVIANIDRLIRNENALPYSELVMETSYA